MKDIILVGYGGHAKSIADCIERGKEYNIIGYTDVRKSDSPYRYLGTDDVLPEYYGKGVRFAVLGIGYMGKDSLRERLYDNIKNIGYSFPVIADPSAVISESAIIEEGTFVGKNAVINAESHIGKMSIINTGAIIEHECVVDDFSHISVGTVLCGQVHIGKAAFIGANATVIQCMEVMPGKIVPAGSVVR